MDRLAKDIQQEFPGMGGFSPQNVWKMRQLFAEHIGKNVILSQAVRELEPPPEVLQIPWGYNMEIIFKVKDSAARLWYAKATKEFGWSRAVLEHQIETDAYGRKGKAVTNFERALPHRLGEIPCGFKSEIDSLRPSAPSSRGCVKA